MLGVAHNIYLQMTVVTGSDILVQLFVRQHVSFFEIHLPDTRWRWKVIENDIVGRMQRDVKHDLLKLSLQDP